jgi:ubiquinone/menaquinone biosynthesis C-methylase UbiE
MKTNEEWKNWGKADPLFGVATWPGKELGGPLPWTDEEFYELGRRDFADFLRVWTRYGLAKQACVEIGCGAGRITKCLADYFDHLEATDVSADMIAYAKSRIPAENIKWHISNGNELPLADHSVNSAFSCHVLQHLPSVDAGLQYFVEVFRVLMPGGTVLIHLPIHRQPVNTKFAGIADTMYRAFIGMKAVHASMKRWRMRHGGLPYMHMISYNEAVLYKQLCLIGYADIEFLTFALSGNGGLHTCVMARRPYS